MQQVQQQQQTAVKLQDIAQLSSSVLFEKAKAQQNDQQLAQKYIRLAIQKDPNNQEYLYFYGNFQKNNDIEQAKKSFQEVIKLNSKHVKSYIMLSYIYHRQQNYPQIQQILKQAIAKNPQKAQLHFILGVMYDYQNKRNQTLQQYNKALQICPSHPLYFCARAGFYYIVNNKFQAFQEMKQLQQTFNKLIDQKNKLQYALKYEISSNSIIWINQKIQEFAQLVQKNEERFFLNNQGLQQLNKAGLKFFEGLIRIQNENDIPYQEMQSKYYWKNMKNKVKRSPCPKNQSQTTNIQQNAPIQNGVFKYPKFTSSSVKQKFNELNTQMPQMKYYFKKLVITICSSVQSYRALQTGILQPGNEGIKSNFNKYVSFLKSGTQFMQKIPLIGGFASMISAVGNYYLKQELDIVTMQIVGAFRDFLPGQELTNGVIQMIIHLSQQQKFIDLIRSSVEEYQLPWPQIIKTKVKNKVDKIKTQIVQNSSDFGGYKLSKEENMAIEHCVQILITIIKKKNHERLQKSESRLLQAGNIWLNQQLFEQQIISLEGFNQNQQIIQIIKKQQITPQPEGWCKMQCSCM